jgi:hypothetical protein
MIPGIQEIKALALKYSKKQLANMAQTGLIDPQKAVMAGMMRDRIAKEDTQPPTTTVAQDVLGLTPPPQMGMQPQPQPQMAQAQQMQQPQQMQQAPQMGAPVEQPPVMAASGGMTSLPIEMQDYAGGGIVAFADRGLVEDEAVYDPITGVQLSGPRPKPFRREVPPGTIYEPSLISDIFSGPISTPLNAPPPPGTKFTNPNYVEPPDAAPLAPPRREAGPRTGRDASPRVSTGPTTPGLKRPDPASYLPDLTQLKPEAFSTRAAQELPAIGKERMDYMRSMGIDPDIYNKMIEKEEGKRKDLGRRKEEAKGEALMQVGLGLLGARRGQEFQTLSEAGTKGLAQLREAGKELRLAEEKLDDRVNSFRMADQQFKQTGAEKDLTKRENELNRVEAAQREAVKDRNTFTTVRAQLGMEGAKIRTQGELSLYGTDVQADLERQKIKIQAQQAANQASYYNKALAQNDARIRAMDAATQARYGKLKIEAGKMWESSDDNRRLNQMLKQKYGDTYMNVPDAQMQMRQAQRAYIGQYLDQNDALIHSAPSANDLMRGEQ